MAKEIKTERLTFRLRKSIKRASRKLANKDGKTLGEWFEGLAEKEIKFQAYITPTPSGATLGKE